MTGESLQELGATGTVLANLLTGLGIAALKPTSTPAAKTTAQGWITIARGITAPHGSGLSARIRSVSAVGTQISMSTSGTTPFLGPTHMDWL
jgi:hypothetical protein